MPDSIELDAQRYRYIRDHYEWRRSTGNFPISDDHNFIGCRFPVEMDFSCAAMIDYNIDKLMDERDDVKKL